MQLAAQVVIKVVALVRMVLTGLVTAQKVVVVVVHGELADPASLLLDISHSRI
jgi:hypothetical protein